LKLAAVKRACMTIIFAEFVTVVSENFFARDFSKARVVQK